MINFIGILMAIQEIVVAALIASSSIATPPFEKQLLGGELGVIATQMCIDDGRNLFLKFNLVKVFKGGTFKVKCQMLETTNGFYYAAKGVYIKDSPMLSELIKIFEEWGNDKGI